MDGQKKLAIVLQGLKGGCCVRELCNDHGITQGMYCKWRNQLLTDGAKLFERGGVDRARERLEHENRKLKAPRKAVTHKPRTVEPNRYWGIDMTKVMISTFGWIYLHVVMDWGTKKTVIHAYEFDQQISGLDRGLKRSCQSPISERNQGGVLYSGISQ